MVAPRRCNHHGEQDRNVNHLSFCRQRHVFLAKITMLLQTHKMYLPGGKPEAARAMLSVGPAEAGAVSPQEKNGKIPMDSQLHGVRLRTLEIVKGLNIYAVDAFSEKRKNLTSTVYSIQ